MMRYRFAALLLFALLAGCARHHGGAPGAASSKGAQSAVTAVHPAAAAPAPAPAAGGAPKAQQPSALVLRPVTEQNGGAPGAGAALSGTAALLPLTVQTPIYPSDYEIGPLQPFPSARPEIEAIYRLTTEFFSQLAKGKVDSSLLDPRWRTIVERFLSFPVRQGTLPESIRIGTLSIHADRASAPVRFARGEGRTSGTLYFDEVDRKWYLSDIQADFGRLSQPFVRKEQYQPESWQWLISK